MLRWFSARAKRKPERKPAIKPASAPSSSPVSASPVSAPSVSSVPTSLLHQFEGKTMGTRYQVVFVLRPDTDRAALGVQVRRAVDAVDAQMSNWKPESDLSRFNRGEPGEWIAMPEDIVTLIAAGQEVARQTRGAFDMTLGAAVAAWGFGPDAHATPPQTDETEGLCGQYGALEARLSPPALRKSGSFSVDLSGIAKGFGVDQIARVLEGQGITSYFVVIDGEVRLSGRKPGLGGPWAIALEAPIAGRREVYDILHPAFPCALATSGDYRHFHTHAGDRYSHTIDGRTGGPVRGVIGSVTVVHETCMMADAWATALLVLGAHDGVALAQARNITARFLIRQTGDELRDVMTGDFARVIG